MLISLNKRMIISGEGHVPGDVVELDDAIAGEWIGRGWAEPVAVTPPVLPEHPPVADAPGSERATMAPAETATSGPQRRRGRGSGTL